MLLSTKAVKLQTYQLGVISVKPVDDSLGKCDTETDKMCMKRSSSLLYPLLIDFGSWCVLCLVILNLIHHYAEDIINMQIAQLILLSTPVDIFFFIYNTQNKNKTDTENVQNAF